MTTSPDPPSAHPRFRFAAGAALGAAALAVPFVLLPVRLAIVGALLGAAMLAIAAIDAERFIIPDWLSLPAIPAGLLASGRLLDPGASELIETGHLIGAFAGGAGLWGVAILYRWWRGEDGLGLGDVKLASAGGAWVGVDLLALMLLLAALACLLTALLVSVRRGIKLEARLRMPFGAFLATSIWVVWMLAVSGVVG